MLARRAGEKKGRETQKRGRIEEGDKDQVYKKTKSARRIMQKKEMRRRPAEAESHFLTRKKATRQKS